MAVPLSVCTKKEELADFNFLWLEDAAGTEINVNPSSHYRGLLLLLKFCFCRILCRKSQMRLYCAKVTYCPYYHHQEPRLTSPCQDLCLKSETQTCSPSIHCITFQARHGKKRERLNSNSI
ncbi:hypothetical protein AVEN_225977-1 [Araneus ventricosus]|uniref:Uncharacterized protein n=1 Tax=Araneus ventricosus TaxID=182803 RepID=A0A4Y2KF52_ARAVE|nr:hypothetical protein AVEN_225977-1 [Araneus ventricosus]